MQVFMSVGLTPAQVRSRGNTIEFEREASLANELLGISFHSLEAVDEAVAALARIRRHIEAVRNAPE